MANAIKAKTWLKHFSLAYTLNGNQPTIMWKTVVTAAIEKGMAVILSTNSIAEAASTSGILFGVAAADGEVADVIPVYVADRNNVFVGQVDNADISAQAFPVACDLVEVSNEHRVDIAESTEKVFTAIAAVSGDTLTDTTDGARVYFQIVRSSFDLLVAAL